MSDQNADVGGTCPDANVEAVRTKLKQRAAVGLLKYGTDTMRTDFQLFEWLAHAQEEAMDFAIYCEAAMNKILSDRAERRARAAQQSELP